MKFSTKSKNLEFLRKLKLKKSIIPNFVYCTVEEWTSKKNIIIKKINKTLEKKITIRSSYFLEDNEVSSMAGEFEGFTNIENNKKKLITFSDKLIQQYKNKKTKKNILLKSEILFQNFLKNSVLSGVITNYCLKDGTDYYVINYDDSSNKTDSVTSGGEKSFRVINIYKKKFLGLRSKKFKKIISAVREIEKKIGLIPIDIEFAIDNKGFVNIFQIRPLSTSKNWEKFSKKKFENYLILNQKKFLNIFKKNKIYGKKPIFGLMPDWNPAEIIGYHPSKFSYSLYKNIITESCWALARKEMGYSYVDRPLMYDFGGKPFVDVRLSFNSLIPEEIKNKLKIKLIKYWSKKLIEKPYLHDKIEFDIVDGSFDASLKKKIQKEYSFFNKREKNEYFEILKKFTNNLILNHKKVFSSLDVKLKYLENERIKFINSYIQNKNINKKEFSLFISKLKKNGTIPFSIYARNAFIAKKILNSFVKEKLLKKKTYSKLLNSIGTITNNYLEIEKKSKYSKKFKKIYLKYFYHLRPGTYDIEINRYNSSILDYKIDQIDEIFQKQRSINLISQKELIKIDKFLKFHKFNINPELLISFCVNSIKMRENSKFIFTRSLSDIIEIMIKIGDKKGISKENLAKMSFNKISDFQKLKTKSSIKIINFDDEKSVINKKIKLPYLITNKSDFFVASILLSKPNYITEKVVEAELATIKSKKDKITNKIVLIENADPGFDWIFSKNIKGLITKFGGVNSHMSIRCEELNIAAAIGVGEDNFNKIKNFSNLILNCKTEKIIDKS
jgi:phosphohistidine swiveling domain-containing protein